MVVLFAFLAASYRASNSDFLRHAAAGRLITQGHYSFGKEPFTWVAGDKHWVNTSWLFDLISYLLYRQPDVGGIVLVVLKATAFALTALLMLLLARVPGRPLLLPAVCVGLAVLAASPYAQLRPACLSVALLAVTLWLLRRPQALRTSSAGETGPGKKHPKVPPADTGRGTWSFWLLPPLFALWANLDSWFILGPITTFLYLLGLGITPRRAALAMDVSGPREWRTLWLVLLVGVAACCLSPFGPTVFASMPPELTRVSTPWPGLFTEWSLSPLFREYFGPSAGLSVAGIAYFVLLLLGAASFVLDAMGPGGLARLLRWRTVLWLAFAWLSLYRARGIAYFAVVAGPITALNLSDFIAWRSAAKTKAVPWPQWALGLRGIALLVVVAAIVATIPGWLQATPHAARRLGWGVAVEPSLEHAADAVLDWQKRQFVPAAAHCLTLSPDATNYLAWFAPGARGFVDDRLELFGNALDHPDKLFSTSEASKTFLVIGAGAVGAQPLAALADQQTMLLVNTLFTRPQEWSVWHLEGGTVIFARRQAAPGAPAGPAEELQAHLVQRAFGASAVAAPATETGPETRTGAWWSELWRPLPSADPLLAEGQLHLMYFRSFAPQGHGPPAALFIAIRVARQAVAGSPDDPRAYLLLAQAYDQLAHKTDLLALSAQVPELGMILRGQIAAAAAHVLRLQPPPLMARGAHGLMLRVCDDVNRQHKPEERLYRDVELRHLRGLVEAMKATGRQPDEPLVAFATKLHEAENDLAKLAPEVGKQSTRYRALAEGKPLLERADIAWKLGLAEEALEVLQSASGPQDWMRPGTTQMLGREVLARILLETGEVEQLGDLIGLERAQSDEGLPWQHVSLQAALGDYARASAILEDAVVRLGSGERGGRVAITRESIVRKLGEVLEYEAIRAGGIVPYGAILWRPPDSYRLKPIVGDPVPVLSKAAVFDSITLGNTLSNLHLLRAWLALEEGAIAEAKRGLNTADGLMPAPQHWPAFLRGQSLAEADRSVLAQLQTTADNHRALYRCCRQWLAQASP
jgi:hypothetical protein